MGFEGGQINPVREEPLILTTRVGDSMIIWKLRYHVGYFSGFWLNASKPLAGPHLEPFLMGCLFEDDEDMCF